MSRTNKSRKLFAATCAAVPVLSLSGNLLLGLGVAGAQVYSWTPAGTTGDSMASGLNWSAVPFSSSDTTLVLVGNNANLVTTASNQTVQDFPGTFVLSELWLQGTGGGTTAVNNLAGGTLDFQNAPRITLNANNGTAALNYNIDNAIVLTNNLIIDGNGSAAFNFSNEWVGAGSVTKTGTSTVFLQGNSTYGTGTTGAATTINGGTLRTLSQNSLGGWGTAGKVVVNNGGSLSVMSGGGGQWGTGEIDTLLTTATFNVGSTLGIQVDTGNLVPYGTNVGGSQSIAKSGGGTLELNGTNTYAGNTVVTGGTLRTSNSAAIPGFNQPGRVQVTGGVLSFVAGGGGQWTSSELTSVLNNASFSGTGGLGFQIDDGNSISISSNVAGSLGLTKTGGGTLVLSGTNTHTGQNNILAGTTVVNNASQLGTGLIFWGNTGTTATIQINSGAPVTITNPVTIDSSNTNLHPAILMANSAVVFSGTFENSDGNGSIEINNSALTTFSGPVHISDNTGARNLRFGGSGEVLISGDITNGTAGATVGSLTYQGSGTMRLTGNNTFGSGASRLDLRSGTLVINSDAQLGNSTIILGAGTTALAESAFFKIDNVNPVTIDNQIFVRGVATREATLIASTPVTFNGGTFSGFNGNAILNIENTALTTIASPIGISNDTSNRNLRFGGSGNLLITGNVTNGPAPAVGSLTYQGSGTMTLTGSNVHSGFTLVQSGNVVITDGSQLGTSTLILGSDTATSNLHVTGANPTISNPITVDSNTATPFNLNLSSAATFSGGLTGTDANAWVNVNSAALTTFSGAVNLSNDDSARTLHIGGTGNVLISGVVGNGGAAANNLTKEGNNTLTLTGANTYTGTTTVSGGRVVLGATAHAPVLTTGAGANVRLGRLIFDYTGGSTVAPTVLGLLDAGYEQPIKFETGQIRSSTTTSLIGLGWKDDTGAQQVTVAYTYYGDADLNGQVDVNDLGTLATNWQTSQAWAGGDFDYDGSVGVNDLGLLATNWQAGVGSPLGPSFADAAAALGLPVNAVPEPASIGLLGLGAWSLRRPRRRRF